MPDTVTRAPRDLIRPEAPRDPARDFLALVSSAGVKSRLQQLLSSPEAADRLIRIVGVAADKTPRLRECTQNSVLQCLLLLASLDLEPNSPLGEAYLIPYAKRKKVGAEWVDAAVECQVQIGYRGLLALASKVPGWQGLTAEAIYEHDEFDCDTGSANFLRHKKLMKGERGAIIGAYAIARINGATLYRVLTRSELDDIRDSSETYRAAARAVDDARRSGDKWKAKKAQEALDATPWVRWEAEMAAKSAIKRLLKLLPLGRHKEARQLIVAAAVDDKLLDLSKITVSDDPLEAPLLGEGPVAEMQDEDEPVGLPPDPEPPADPGPQWDASVQPRARASWDDGARAAIAEFQAAANPAAITEAQTTYKRLRHDLATRAGERGRWLEWEISAAEQAALDRVRDSDPVVG